MKSSICIIIQARMGSTRLPGKIFKDLCGKPVLWHVYNRVGNSKLVNKIVIATTDQPKDDQVEKFCMSNSILYYRGSTDDVLSRYYEAAKKFGADIVVRITSDCPVIDPVILDNMIREYINVNKQEPLDYLSNSIVRTFPRGLDVEIFSFQALEKAHNEAKLQYQREHVTPYIYQHPEIFTIKNFANETDYSFHRWTLDTTDDFKLIEKIYNGLFHQKEIFLFEDILKLFDENPELLGINKEVQQKNLKE